MRVSVNAAADFGEHWVVDDDEVDFLVQIQHGISPRRKYGLLLEEVRASLKELDDLNVRLAGLSFRSFFPIGPTRPTVPDHGKAFAVWEGSAWATAFGIKNIDSPVKELSYDQVAPQSMQPVNTARVVSQPSLESLAVSLNAALKTSTSAGAAPIADLARQILGKVDRSTFEDHSDLLSQACFRIFEVGESSTALRIAKQIAARAEQFDDLRAHRRVANIIGLQYCDLADFASAMEYLELAVVLARRLGNALFEAACVSNVIMVLQEMGHYRQAISMVDRVLSLEDSSAIGISLKLQCASNGLFAAHRAGDKVAAARFLDEGQSHLPANSEPLRRAFFEKNRVLYLVDLGRSEEAASCLHETRVALQDSSTPRIEILMTLASAVLDWATGSKDHARQSLKQLYIKSHHSKFYHHFVLQALVKVYGDASSVSEAKIGLDYARELVEYTTSVKKAKFYRQIADKRVAKDGTHAVHLVTSVDPFATVRDWLTASEVVLPSDDLEPAPRRQLAKHEELTVIHEDMARLRAMSIRRDIRTDAVDTAENWAIAAEFFDDETGQHCYRVGHLASMLARQIGLDETFCVQVEHAARLHDIGKIAVNELILLKPGPLDAAEMAAMRLHTEVGAQILGGSDDPVLRMATDVARHHHEWWNGAGYPTKRSGKDIPMSARVCAYADVYDALTHMRAYKKAWTHERALDEIVRLKSTQFDPDLLDPFIAVLDRYRADLAARAIPGFADMDSNTLIASRKKLMETISGTAR